MYQSQTFILIDDDLASLMISEIIIKKNIEGYVIHKFIRPSEGLAFLLEEYMPDPYPATLLLDINMPGLNGWELLENLESHFYKANGMLDILMLSSSINPQDMAKAARIPMIKGFLVKPLSRDRLLNALKGDFKHH